MPIKLTQNQSLGFNIPAPGCDIAGEYCQPIEVTDQINIQGYVNSIGNNLVLHGDFDSSTNWTLGAGWSVSGGKLNAPGVATTTTSDPLGLVAGNLYIVKIVATVTTPGTGGWYVKFNNSTLAMPGASRSTSLTGTWAVIPGTITTDCILFGATDNTIHFEIDSIAVYECAKVGLSWYQEGVYTGRTSLTTGTDIKYYLNNSLISAGSSVLYAGSLAYNSWSILFNTSFTGAKSGITGCQTWGFYDEYLLENAIRNGAFATSLDYWTVGAHWTWDASAKAKYTPDGITAGELKQSINVLGGTTYRLTFQATGLGVSGTMQYAITYPDSSVVTTVFTGNGTEEKDIDLTDYTGEQTIQISFQEHSSSQTYYVDNVTLKLKTEPDTFNLTECLDIQTTHDCTLLLSANNNDDAFDFNYTADSTFTKYLRVGGRMDVNGYPEEKEVYLFSDNTRATMFSRTETERIVILGDAPDYIHAAVRVFRLHDTFKIDGTQYVCDQGEAYNHRRRKTSILKQADFMVKDYTVIGSNYSCS